MSQGPGKYELRLKEISANAEIQDGDIWLDAEDNKIYARIDGVTCTIGDKLYPSGFGAQGPQGPQGATGPQGGA